MHVTIYMIVSAIIFDNISWLTKLSGILLIISSVLAIIETYKDKKFFIKVLLYILLIIAGFYMIID